MKHLALSVLAAAVLLPGPARAAGTIAVLSKQGQTIIYTNNGVVANPQINAATVLNYGTFEASLGLRPYATYGTLNYTNWGIMESLEGGFQFQNLSPTTSQDGFAANFVNLNPGIVVTEDIPSPSFPAGCVVAVVQPGPLWIFATNIISRGGTPGAGASMEVGADSELKLVGTNIDLSTSGLESIPVWDEPVGWATLTVGGTLTEFEGDIANYDEYWGQGAFDPIMYRLNSGGLWDGTTAHSQSDPSPPASQASRRMTLQSPALLADSDVQIIRSQTVIITNFMGTPPLTNMNQFFTVAVTFPSNELKTAIFIGYPNDGAGWSAGDEFGGQSAVSGFQTEVGATLSVPIINAVTQLPETASFTVRDTLGNAGANDLGVIPDAVGCPTNGFRPRCYVHTDRENLFAGANGNNGVPDPNFFLSTGVYLDASQNTYVIRDAVTNASVGAGNWADYSSFLDNIVSRPKQIPAGTPTNNPGRVRIFADKLNLDNTRIRADGQIQISTPHLLSSSNTVIDCENVSLDLSSTNGSLKVENLVPPGFVSRFRGSNYFWSATWSNPVQVVYQNFSISNLVFTNIDNGVTNVETNFIPVETDLTNYASVSFQTLMVDGTLLARQVPASVLDFATHSPDVKVNDNLQVVGSAAFNNARSVTINGGVTIVGAYPINPVTSTALPGTPMQNWTASTAPDVLYFTNNGVISVPNEAHFGDDRPPYQDFINNGTLSAGGVALSSFYYEIGGTLATVDGGLFVSGDTGKLNGGTVVAGNVAQFLGNNLKFNSYTLNAAGALSFYVTNSLSDGGPGSGNRFTLSDGFNLMVKPALGDFLGTTFLDATPGTPASRITHIWAAQDRGPSTAGYQNNEAIGVLSFAPQNTNSFYAFFGPDQQSAYALYVDKLDLSRVTDIKRQLQLAPNFTVYYAAVALSSTPPVDTNGIAQLPEEYLNGTTVNGGGHLVWVPSFAGPNSSTAVVVINPATGLPQSIQVNTALRNSKIIDSNGDGIPNGDQGYPASGSPFTVGYLAVSTNGNGTVTPNYNGQLLVSNAVYSMLAQPADGFVFSGWTGDLTSTNPLLTFTMTGSLSLTANFTYVPGAGTYSGLFYQAGSIQAGQSGSITITKSANGKFSGSVQLAGNRYSFSGTLDGNGAATVNIANSGLVLQLQAGTATLTGTVSGDPPGPVPAARMANSRHTPSPAGVWAAPFQANLNVFNSKTNPAPFAGPYTIIFPGSGQITNPTVPFGDGYGSVTVDANGNVKFSGALADGTKVTQSATVSQNGQWPLFVPLYNGQGQILSWQTFGVGGAPDISGSYNWIRPVTNGKLYPNGFNVSGTTSGSVYDSKQAPITGFSPGLLQFFGGDLSGPITDLASISTNNKTMNLGPAKVTLALSPNQGFFSGNVTDPMTKKVYNFNGAMLQKQGVGSGFLLGPDQSGKVTLTPNL